MLEHLSTLAAAAHNLWAGYSLVATLTGFGGLALVAAALFLGAYLPSFLKTPVVVAGAVLAAFAVGAQYGQGEGAAAQRLLDTQRALAAENRRRAEAETIARANAAAAVAEREAALSDQKSLQELIDAVVRDTASGRLCGSRDDARRLRALRDGAR